MYVSAIPKRRLFSRSWIVTWLKFSWLFSQKRLSSVKVNWKKQSALCVVLASGGYPGVYEKGKLIKGLETKQESSIKIFHAGTLEKRDGIVTAGGRVLCVTGIADSLGAARDKAYSAAKAIGFDGKVYRKDIGAKALAVTGRAV
jgi:phosphoribosylamine--glycine ligase